MRTTSTLCQYTLEGKINTSKEWTVWGNYAIKHDAIFAANCGNVTYRLRDNETGKIVWRG
jgi:hypothetical protein